MKTPPVESVDAYLEQFEQPVRGLLDTLRATIREMAPLAEEYIGYQMPAYKHKGPLVYFAGYKGHVGFYPTGSGITAFAHEFGNYKYSKGAVQFPIDAPLPLDLIRRIVAHRIAENDAADHAKKAAKKTKRA